MMLPQNLACTASFMVVGLYEGPRGLNNEGVEGYSYGELIKRWEAGCVELHLELAQYAALSETIITYVTSECSLDFPGVYEYEVSEPFGRWFGERVFNGRVPEWHVAAEELAALAARFFTYPHDAPSTHALYDKIMAHLKETCDAAQDQR